MTTLETQCDIHALQASCCRGDVNYETVFPDSGALHRSCLALASSTKVSCGRKRARMTNTSRNGIGASKSLTAFVGHCAHSLGCSLPTRKFFRRRACASSMEAICCPATQRWSNWRRSLSDRWRLDTKG